MLCYVMARHTHPYFSEVFSLILKCFRQCLFWSLKIEFQRIEALFEELKRASITALDRNIRLGIDHLQSDEDTPVAAAERKLVYGDRTRRV